MYISFDNTRDFIINLILKKVLKIDLDIIDMDRRYLPTFIVLMNVNEKSVVILNIYFLKIKFDFFYTFYLDP